MVQQHDSVAKICELERQTKRGFLDFAHHGLEIITLFTGDAHLVLLDLSLQFKFRFLHDLDDFARNVLVDTVACGDFLPRRID